MHAAALSPLAQPSHPLLHPSQDGVPSELEVLYVGTLTVDIGPGDQEVRGRGSGGAGWGRGTRRWAGGVGRGSGESWMGPGDQKVGRGDRGVLGKGSVVWMGWGRDVGERCRCGKVGERAEGW